jgi:hypothetical protein
VWVDLPVDVYLHGIAHRCRIVDLSLSGMLIELPPALAVDRPLMFGAYAIHGGPQPLRVDGRMVWQDGLVRAARFVFLPTAERAALGALVDAAHRRAAEISRLDLAERRDGERWDRLPSWWARDHASV